jgi:hypothetical protein
MSRSTYRAVRTLRGRLDSAEIDAMDWRWRARLMGGLALGEFALLVVLVVAAAVGRF